MKTGHAYDAVSMLGFGEASAEPLPDPAPGEVIIRVGAWSLQELRINPNVVRKQLMHDQDWYVQYPWSTLKLVPGVYRVRVRIPKSNDKNFFKQTRLLLPDEEVAPTALAVAALLCHLKQNGEDLLDCDWTRCAEMLPLPDGRRVELSVYGGRVSVYRNWDDYRSDDVWLAGCRKSCTTPLEALEAS